MSSHSVERSRQQHVIAADNPEKFSICAERALVDRVENAVVLPGDNSASPPLGEFHRAVGAPTVHDDVLHLDVGALLVSHRLDAVVKVPDAIESGGNYGDEHGRPSNSRRTITRLHGAARRV
jgi:hypothetical protein